MRGARAAALVAALALADGAPRAAPVAASEPQSPAAMSLEQAYGAAEQLVGARRHLESLPYFRRMIELLPADDWSLRHDYANALQGAAMQSRTLRGLPVRAVRSSFESIALMRSALDELDRAERLAPTPRAAASVHLARARQLAAWGLPWDACAEAHQAASADPSWGLAALAAHQWTRRIAGPDFSLGTDSDSDSASARRPSGRGARR